MHRHPPTRAAPRSLAVAAIVAALAAATPAGAQPRKEPAAKTSTSAPAARPAQIPLPPPPATAPPKAGRVGTLAMSVGPWVGFDVGESVALLVDYGYLRTPESWRRLELEVRLSVMLSRPTDETDLTTTITPPVGPPVEIASGFEKTSAWVIEVVPTLRVRLPLNPKFALFVDGGLGLAQTIERYEREELYLGASEETQNVTGLVLRLGAGMAFQLSERTRVVFLPLALSVQIGPDFSAFVPTLGVAYRL